MAVKQVFDEQVARVHEAGEARVQDVMRLMDEQLELQRRDLQGMHNRLQRALEDNVRLGQELREAFYSVRPSSAV